MPITTNDNFVRLLDTIQGLGIRAVEVASQQPAYQKFVGLFRSESWSP
jgi:hypothetical protein